MRKTHNIPRREIIGVTVRAVLAAVLLCGGLLIADCNQCLYRNPQRHYSPDGGYVVVIRQSSRHYFTLGRNLKVTAAGDKYSERESRIYRDVDILSVEWQDDDTALLTMSGGRDCVVRIDFSEDDKPVFTEE